MYILSGDLIQLSSLPAVYVPFARSNWDQDKCMTHEFVHYHPLLAQHNDQAYHQELDRLHMHI